ncbi:nucleotide exchange factor GrpE [Aeromicrobium chenweiae]|uniref:Protein GrpE n=1 Tax=Aeromicrobium chenweiae TaxID=2079793 RepID=A0A2S0WR36_9ACTN|nr:nucleotide exchange factor GrpE [Aeromicrobium chenweiae]AWB93760.1 nucleotide exchange factor GrpE [Aeromicrobium chenweiae]TGN30391.1 nucleotide exchange factor GrpE [Aeromicrobium chenweiae]
MTEPGTDSAPEQEPTPAEEAQPAEAPAGPSLEQQLAERTLDLQRLQAEYVNYKRRVDRDRELVRAQGEAAVLQSLLTVLDDIGRAAEHGELSGGFKAVADSLQNAVSKHKLEAFGAKGDAFDPSLHEAVFHAGESADVDTTTVDTVMRTGYKIGDRVLRAATVGVVDPASSAPEPAEPSTEASSPEAPAAESADADDNQH